MQREKLEVDLITFLKKYRRQLTHQETGLPFAPSPQSQNTKNKTRFTPSRKLRLAVKVFAPLCFVVFFISFFWNPAGILSSCSVAGLIGFGTNWIAIKMLFWPRQARPIFNHGLIPSQRDQIIAKITDDVLERLINEDLIRQKIVESGVLQKFTFSVGTKIQTLIHDPEFQRDLRNLIVYYTQKLVKDSEFRENIKQKIIQKVEEYGGNNFTEWLLMRTKKVWKQSFVNIIDREVEQLPQILEEILEQADNLLARIPQVIEENRETIENILTKMQMGLICEINIRSIVMEQLEKVTAEELERGFKDFSDDKLSFITILGGILGIVGGFVILWPLYSLIAILALLLFLFLLDIIIFRILSRRE